MPILAKRKVEKTTPKDFIMKLGHNKDIEAFYAIFIIFFSYNRPWNDINCNVCEYKSSANKTYLSICRQRERCAAVLGRTRAVGMVTPAKYMWIVYILGT